MAPCISARRAPPASMSAAASSEARMAGSIPATWSNAEASVIYFIGRRRWHHQCRRPQDQSGGSRSGDQPSSRRAHVAGFGPQESHHRRHRDCRGCAGRCRQRQCHFQQAILDVCREKLPAFKVPAMLRFVPALELTAGGKLSPSCVTFLSAVATRGVGLPSRARLAEDGYSRLRPGPQGKRRAERGHRGTASPANRTLCPSIFPRWRRSPTWSAN